MFLAPGARGYTTHGEAGEVSLSWVDSFIAGNYLLMNFDSLLPGARSMAYCEFNGFIYSCQNRAPEFALML